MQAAAGQQPDYLTRLLGEAEPARHTAMRAALRGDCHTHSDWSDGGSPPREMAEAARALGHEWIALTDHSPRLTAGRGRPESQFDPERVFAACRDHGVAVEINCRPERQDPPDPLLHLAADMGCLFAIDTDAHAPGQLDWLGSGCARAEAQSIDPGRVINTSSADTVSARPAG